MKFADLLLFETSFSKAFNWILKISLWRFFLFSVITKWKLSRHKNCHTWKIFSLGKVAFITFGISKFLSQHGKFVYFKRNDIKHKIFHSIKSCWQWKIFCKAESWKWSKNKFFVGTKVSVRCIFRMVSAVRKDYVRQCVSSSEKL